MNGLGKVKREIDFRFSNCSGFLEFNGFNKFIWLWESKRKKRIRQKDLSILEATDWILSNDQPLIYVPFKNFPHSLSLEFMPKRRFFGIVRMETFYLTIHMAIFDGKNGCTPSLYPFQFCMLYVWY